MAITIYKLSSKIFTVFGLFRKRTYSRYKFTIYMFNLYEKLEIFIWLSLRKIYISKNLLKNTFRKKLLNKKSIIYPVFISLLSSTIREKKFASSQQEHIKDLNYLLQPSSLNFQLCEPGLTNFHPSIIPIRGRAWWWYKSNQNHENVGS